MKKGFTLIELLIVIAIIGILAGIVVGVTNRARVSAATKATKATLSGLRAAIALCCDAGGTLQTTAGSDVCNPAINSYLPNATQLNLGSGGTVTYTVSGTCTAAEPGYTVRLTNHPNSSCNNADFTVTITRFTSPCD